MRRLLSVGSVRVRWLVVTGVVLAAVVVLSGLIQHGFEQVARARAERARLLEERAELEREVARLQQTVDALATSSAAVEALARQELGWIRPGEEVWILPTAEPPPAILTASEQQPILALRR